MRGAYAWPIGSGICVCLALADAFEGLTHGDRAIVFGLSAMLLFVPPLIYPMFQAYAYAQAAALSKVHGYLRDEVVFTFKGDILKKVDVDWKRLRGRELIGVAWTTDGETDRIGLVFESYAVTLDEMPGNPATGEVIAPFMKRLAERLGVAVPERIMFVPNDYQPSFWSSCGRPWLWLVASAAMLVAVSARLGAPQLVLACMVHWYGVQAGIVESTKSRDQNADKLAWLIRSSQVEQGEVSAPGLVDDPLAPDAIAASENE